MGERKREWEVIRLRAKGEYLGRVSAVDEKSAVKAALKLLSLDKSEARRLLIRPA
jgi:hypothetical protein